MALATEIMTVNGLGTSEPRQPITAWEIETSPPCAHSIVPDSAAPDAEHVAAPAVPWAAQAKLAEPDNATALRSKKDLPGLSSIKSRVAVR